MVIGLIETVLQGREEARSEMNFVRPQAVATRARSDHVVSYADDYVICCKGDVDEALAEMRWMTYYTAVAAAAILPPTAGTGPIVRGDRSGREQLRYRFDRACSHGPESGSEHERSRIQGRGIQPHRVEGRRVRQKRSQGYAGRRDPQHRRDVPRTEEAPPGDVHGEGRSGGRSEH